MSIASLLAGSLGGSLGAYGAPKPTSSSPLYPSSPFPMTGGGSSYSPPPASGGGDDPLMGIVLTLIMSLINGGEEEPAPAPAPVVVPAPAPADNGISDVLMQLLNEVKGIKESLLTPAIPTPAQPEPEPEPEPVPVKPVRPAPEPDPEPIEEPVVELPKKPFCPPKCPVYCPPPQVQLPEPPVIPQLPQITHNTLPNNNQLKIRVWGDPHYELGKVKFDHHGDADRDVFNLITSDGGNFVHNTMYRRNGDIAVNGNQGFKIKGPDGITKVEYLVDSKQLKITKPNGSEQILDSNTPEGQRLVKVKMNANEEGTQTADAEVEWTTEGFRIKTFETQVTAKRSDTPWKELNYVDLSFDTTNGINKIDNQNDNGMVASTFDKNYKGTNDKPFNVAGVEKTANYFKVQNGDLFGMAESNAKRTDEVDLTATGNGTSK